MKLSVQLWTVRDDLNRDPAGTLKALAAIGLRYVETAGTANRPAKDFAGMVRDAGLKVSGMHVGLDACEKDLGKVLEEAALFETRYVIVPWIAADVYKDGWDKAGMRLQAVGEKVAATKRVFAYHNHEFEFQDAGGRTGFDRMMEAACPDFVKAQIDLWWAYVGKQDVAALVRKHKARTPLVHLKDGSSPTNQVHQPAGKGVMPWPEVLRACEEAKVEFGSIELDTSPGKPLDAVRESYNYFRSKGYR